MELVLHIAELDGMLYPYKTYPTKIYSHNYGDEHGLNIFQLECKMLKLLNDGLSSSMFLDKFKSLSSNQAQQSTDVNPVLPKFLDANTAIIFPYVWQTKHEYKKDENYKPLIRIGMLIIDQN